MAKLSLKFLTDYYSIVSIAFWLEYGGFFFFFLNVHLLFSVLQRKKMEIET